ncbi:hypothetical protein GCM10009798_17950 [Nocardioides panacihumi]|uniref:Bacterial transcriptional activator domain-containing protein n=1 Tax=Nocardioides panacihumi TaxID=400774 RepID=A0ABN2QVA5_9ACTN
MADGEDVALSHREQRLTAVLGLTGRSSRLHVAGVLWPDSTDDRALASLRRAVRQTQERCPGLLQADRLSIGLDADVEVDVDELRHAAAAEDAIAEGAAAAMLGLLVGEELLPGWYDEWVLPERERLEQLRVKALERIARQAIEAGDLALCVDAAHAISDVNPLLESAAELAIRAHLGRGDLGSALLEFDRYRHAVREELGVPPSRTIVELIEPALAESRTATDDPDVPASVPVPVHAAPARPDVPTPTLRGDDPDEEEPEFARLLGPAAATSAVRGGVVIADRPREPVVSTGGRGAMVRLLGVAALLLAASIVVLGVGHTPGGGNNGGGAGSPGVTHPNVGVLPADSAIHPSTMLVRLVGATAGRAAFLVRTATQPALVRIEMHGNVGGNIVRSVLVRSPNGRRLELSGLRPGIYRWLATSSVAAAVGGRLRIPDRPVAVPVNAAAHTNSGTTVEAVDAATPPAASSAGSTTGSSAGSSAAGSAAPQPSSGNPQPHPAPRPHPTRQPRDPGAQPVGPVG